MSQVHQNHSISSEFSPHASDLPRGIGQPAWRALTGAGYWRLEQVAAAGEQELLRLHGVGPKAIRALRGALANRGLSFAGE